MQNRGVALIAAVVIVATAGALYAASPETLTVGGTVQQAADGTSSTGSTWCVYAAAQSGERESGVIDASNGGVWLGDVDRKPSVFSVGADCVVAVFREGGGGTIGHTGYYAVVNHVLTGDDPAEFPEMTLRALPRPAVTSTVLAHLTWDAAIEDAGEAGKTNIIGYTVSRSSDGISFAPVSTSLVTDTQFDDTIPNDAEYYYAVGLVFRGDPPVTGAVLSANSIRTYKDTDSDTLPDYFEIANGLDATSGGGTNGPAGDADGDTMSNMEEWIAGTRANDRGSCFFAKSVAPAGDGVTIKWDGVADRRYSIYRISHLASNDWVQIYGPAHCPSNRPMQYFDLPEGPGPYFYRIKVSRD